MEQIKHVYNDVKDNNEIAIIEKYGSHAKHCTAILTSKIPILFFIYFKSL